MYKKSYGWQCTTNNNKNLLFYTNHATLIQKHKIIIVFM